MIVLGKSMYGAAVEAPPGSRTRSGVVAPPAALVRVQFVPESALMSVPLVPPAESIAALPLASLKLQRCVSTGGAKGVAVACALVLFVESVSV